MRCVCQTGTGYWVHADVRPLTREEEAECLEHAIMKSRASRGKRKDSAFEKTLEQHRAADLRGARGEKAWSIFWDIEWPKRIDDFVNPDFDPDIEIRTTQMDPPELILRTRDMREKAHRRYVLVHERWDMALRIVGWVRPQEVEDFQTEDRGQRGAPARFIPVRSLHRFPFYPKSLNKHRSPI